MRPTYRPSRQMRCWPDTFFSQGTFVAATTRLQARCVRSAPHRDLSVTRHASATQSELWAVGENVAAACDKRLHGRGDVSARVCLAQDLTVVATVFPGQSEPCRSLSLASRQAYTEDHRSRNCCGGEIHRQARLSGSGKSNAEGARQPCGDRLLPALVELKRLRRQSSFANRRISWVVDEP